VDAFNLVAAASSILALAFAVWQYAKARQERAREEERLAAQNRAVKAALGAALAGAHASDLIVQRAKDPDATVRELQNLARVARGVAFSLASQLEEQSALLRQWEFGQRMTQSERRGTR